MCGGGGVWVGGWLSVCVCVCLFWVFPSFHGTSWEQSHITTLTSGSGSRDDYSAAPWELILQRHCTHTHTHTHTHKHQALQAHTCTDWHSQMAQSLWQWNCCGCVGVCKHGTKTFTCSGGSWRLLIGTWIADMNKILLHNHAETKSII